jgi:hypothetical protein
MKEKKESIVKKIIKDHQTIGVIGLAKNTGKTTTLNYMIKHIDAKVIGLTSIGLDGESLDQVNFLPKPKIWVKKGMIVANASACLDSSQLSFEVLVNTHFQTAIGDIKIVKVLEEGYMMIAGPTTNKALNDVVHLMKQYATLIIIDGAFNRMTFSNISELDQIVLASGAAYHPIMEETILQTAFIVNLFKSPKTLDKLPFKHSVEILTDKQTYCLDDKKESTLKSFFSKNQEVIQSIFIKGAITQKIINLFVKEDLNHIKLIMDDPTKLLISHQFENYFSKRVIKLEVLRTTPISCVTINPWSPSGIHYDQIIFEKQMKKSIDIPVFNVYHMEDNHV